MNLNELGEGRLIERFASKLSQKLPAQVIGIGDDAAVIPWNEAQSLLVSTDLLLEDVHFLRTLIPAHDLGHKALAVNLSDIAAMGGTPTSAFLSLGLPGHLNVEWVDAFFEGFQELARKHSVQILGGDTTESKTGVVINVSILGQVPNQNIKLRSAAKAGDLICVTGALGDSAAGLRCLLENKPETAFTRSLIRSHHRPTPHVREGAWLAQFQGVHALMDVSDGLDLSLKEILRQSACGAEVDLNQLPISPELKEASDFYAWGPSVIAAAGGEDYVLVLTVSAEAVDEIRAAYQKEFSRELFVIGKITANTGALDYQLEGQAFLGPLEAWKHFD